MSGILSVLELIFQNAFLFSETTGNQNEIVWEKSGKLFREHRAIDVDIGTIPIKVTEVVLHRFRCSSFFFA